MGGENESRHGSRKASHHTWDISSPPPGVLAPPSLSRRQGPGFAGEDPHGASSTQASHHGTLVCICGSGPHEGNIRRPAEYEGDGRVRRVGTNAGVWERVYIAMYECVWAHESTGVCMVKRVCLYMCGCVRACACV